MLSPHRDKFIPLRFYAAASRLILYQRDGSRPQLGKRCDGTNTQLRSRQPGRRHQELDAPVQLQHNARSFRAPWCPSAFCHTRCSSAASARAATQEPYCCAAAKRIACAIPHRASDREATLLDFGFTSPRQHTDGARPTCLCHRASITHAE